MVKGSRIVKKSFFGLKTRIIKPRKKEACVALQITSLSGKTTVSNEDMHDLKMDTGTTWGFNASDMLFLTKPIKIRGQNKTSQVSIVACFRRM